MSGVDCPSCRAPHPDEAEYCTLCYARLRAAPPPTAAFAAFAEVETLSEGYLLRGPLVMRPEALWFFVRSCRRTSRGRLGNVGGFQLGGLYARLIQLMLDLWAESLGLGAPRRPEKLDFRPSRHVVEEAAGAVAAAPLIPACADYFAVEKADLVSASFSAVRGTLTLKTRWTELAVSGAEPRERAAGFLKSRGYPLMAG